MEKLFKNVAALGNKIAVPFQGISKLALLILVFSTVFNTLFLSQGVDLNHTVISSYAYLNGHFSDFYDFNSTIVVRNDYLPFIYLVFAAWMSPFKVAGKLPDEAVSQALFLSPWEIVWAKTLILLAFLIAFYLLWKICEHLLPNDERNQRVVVWAFLFSPFAAYAVTAFSQYDIIGIDLALAGLLSYLRNKKIWFVVFFAAAISIKFFALILFVPLVLLKYKKIWHVISLLLGGASLTLLQVLIYLPNQSFAANFLVLAERKTGESTTSIFSIVVLIAALVGCIYIWRLRATDDYWGVAIALISATSYGLFFEASTWHPQWIILIVPYFALAAGFLSKQIAFFCFEILGFLSFTWITVNGFVLNADAIMLERGPLHSLLPTHKTVMADFYASSYLAFATIMFSLYLISPIIYWFIQHKLKDTEQSRNIPEWIWVSRALAFPVFFTLPALLTLV